MMPANRSSRIEPYRSLRPVLVSLEDRVLLNAAMPHDPHGLSASAESTSRTNRTTSRRQGPRPDHHTHQQGQRRRLYLHQFRRTDPGHERRRPGPT